MTHAPASWYPNPTGDGVRFWDGAQWTDQTAPAPTPPAPPVAPPAPPADDADEHDEPVHRRRRPRRLAGRRPGRGIEQVEQVAPETPVDDAPVVVFTAPPADEPDQVVSPEAAAIVEGINIVTVEPFVFTAPDVDQTAAPDQDPQDLPAALADLASARAEIDELRLVVEEMGVLGIVELQREVVEIEAALRARRDNLAAELDELDELDEARSPTARE